MSRPEPEALYRRYGALVLRRARTLLGDEDEARDALQEVFVLVLRNLSGFRAESSPATWLYRVTTNHCLNRLRARRPAAPLPDGDRAPGVPARDGAADARAALRCVLAAVGPELATVAVYYYVDEMDQEEIAAIVGVSRRTVGNRLEEFRGRARAILEEA